MIAFMLILNVLMGLLGGFALHLVFSHAPEMWRRGGYSRTLIIVICALGIPTLAFCYWMMWYQTILIWKM